MKIKTKESSVDVNSKLQQVPIAVIGVSALFPDAGNKDEYWNNIVSEVDSIIEVPESRWKIDDYYDPDPKTPDKTYCKRGGFIPDIDFNPMEFGLPPNFLEVTDVSQLLALIVARDVLKDGGYEDENAYDRDNIGITLGVGGGQKLISPLTTRLQYPIWQTVLENSGVSKEDTEKIIEKICKAYIPWEENSFPGMLGNVISGRVANRLNLGGTNCVLDAACAGSLAALKMAVSDLIEGRSEMMITGGVDTDNSPFMYLCFSKTPAFTTDDSLKAFDTDSKGMLVGEGVGMVLLKRLDDAKRDNDKIYAVIKGIGTSSDGKFKSIYAPRPEGQAKALRRAYEKAGYSPSTSGLLEAHGTGTAAGDNAEFKALKMVFGESFDENQQIALGSVKSQIGHAKSAAGSAGFIKAVLALHHKVLPATINVTKPHPDMDIENSPFYVNNETRPWFPSKDGNPRRAGVSAFGFGGTNFHVALEEFTKSHTGRYRLHETPYSVIIKEENSKNLLEKCKSIKSSLDSDNDDLAYYKLITENSIAPVEKNHARVGFVTSSIRGASDSLEIIISKLEKNSEVENFTHPKGIHYRACGIDTDGAVVSLFSGQGSQYVNMGKEVAINFPVVTDSFSEIDKIFLENGRDRLTDSIFPIPKFNNEDKKDDQTKITKTENAQPAIGTISAGFYKTFKHAGYKSDFTAGHSFGELTALWAAGVINESDFYYLAMSRGLAMAAPDDENFDAGGMLAVMGKTQNLNDDLKDFSDITIANHNSNNQVVIAGTKEAAQNVTPYLKEKGYNVISLPVSAAFHTSLVGHAQKPFADAVDTVKFNKPDLPVYSNTTSKKYPDNPKEIKQILKNHILNPVLFKDEIENIYNSGGRIFVEFGPKNVLAKLVGNILEDKEHIAVSVNSNSKECSDKSLRKAAVELCVCGIALSDIDPYRILPEKPETKKAGVMNIKLNGSNYVSDKTKKAFEDSLNDGFKIAQAEPVVVIEKVEVPVEKIVTVVKEVSDKTPLETDNINHIAHEMKKGEDIMQKLPPKQNPDMGLIQSGIDNFFKHQSETLSVHAQYISNAGDYTKSFHDLIDKQFEIVKNNPDIKIPENIGKSMEMFHQYHGETLKVHADYLKHSAETAISALSNVESGYYNESQTITQTRRVESPELARPIVSSPEIVQKAFVVESPQAEPVVTATIPAPPVSNKKESVILIDSKKLKEVMLSIVSDKTGYPTEMLDLDMDMEADLGIDSIKRVEILSAVTEAFPDMPEVNPNELAELKTLGEIVDKMEGDIAAGQQLAETILSNSGISGNESTNSAAAPLIDSKKLQEVMLSIVSDKTGYPPEMLDLEMDMEADLGIDSIKRVEILSAVTEAFPDMPEVNPDELAELKTLGEIVDKMEDDITTGQQPAETISGNESSTSTEVPLVDTKKLKEVMLSIVSDKTGYPTEMLQLDMDMEADLGIDSIKRVEILAAVTEAFPNMPEVNPDELAELKTLGEIVDKMEGGVIKEQHPVEIVSTSKNSDSPIDLEKLSEIMLSVVSDKTGYPTEMLELDMDMESELGIDSIKRVEILAAVTEAFPNMPEVNPDELAALKTLGEIVDKMANIEGRTSTQTEVENETETIAGKTERSVAVLKSIPSPDILDLKLNDGDCCVLTDDGTDLTYFLAAALSNRGFNPVVLSNPKAVAKEFKGDDTEIKREILSDMTEETLSAAFVNIEKTYGKIGGFVHLSPKPSEASKDSIIFEEDEKEFLLRSFLSAGFLKNTLNEKRGDRHFYIAITRMDGKLGTTGKDTSLVSGGYFGLTKTLNLEWPDVFCRTIDISCELSDEKASIAIEREILDPDKRITETAVGKDGRYTLEAVVASPEFEEQNDGITEKSVFLVSGGAKGVTSQCVQKLAEDTKCSFILLGRSVYSGNPDPKWAEGITDNAELKKAIMLELKEQGEKPTPKLVTKMLKPILSDREISSALEKIKAAGANAEYVSADVTDSEAVKKNIKEATTNLGEITGIIHGAGVLADKFIEDKTTSDFNSVYSTKVSGLESLLDCVDTENLTHVALFSSAAGFFGNEGQSDYAVANDILNKASYKIKALFPNCHVNSFCWGPWDGGMVTPELKRMFEQKGINVIPISKGASLFSEEMRMVECFPQVIVGSSMLYKAEAAGDDNTENLKTHKITHVLKLSENNFLYDHSIGGKPVLPTVCATFLMADSCEKLYPGFKFKRCSNYRLYKGIVFDGNESSEYILNIVETKKSDDIIFDVKITSLDNNGKTVNHYSADIITTNTTPSAKVISDFDLTESDAEDGSLFYKNGTLFHGPNFQAIEKILNISENRLTMECRIPMVSIKDQGNFRIGTFNPYAADVQFQSMLIWVRKFMDAGSLPSKAEDALHYENVPTDKKFYVTLNITKKAQSSICADIYTHDENGKVYTSVSGAEVTFSKQLNELFVKAV